jgi:hypothetical protein
MRITGVPAHGAIVVLVGLLLGASAGASDAPGGGYVESVRAVVDAFGAGDFGAFASQFARKVRGMQPDELWEGAQTLVTRFGEIENVALASFDEDSGGAFVKVTFARAERELFVRLDGEGRIRQLTYVPPDIH